MNTTIPVRIVIAGAFAVLSASQAFAQHVHYFSSDTLTYGNLVHALTPPPQYNGSRELIRNIGRKPPECSHLIKNAKATRGLAPVAKADIASIEVEFDVNSAALRPESEKTLDTLGQALKSDTLKPCCFEIAGYTDATGSAEYNQKLSEDRANSVIDYLNAHEEIERDRMTPKGFGKSDPIASNATDEGRQENRRVQVVNLGYGD